MKPRFVLGDFLEQGSLTPGALMMLRKRYKYRGNEVLCGLFAEPGKEADRVVRDGLSCPIVTGGYLPQHNQFSRPAIAEVPPRYHVDTSIFLLDP